MTKPLLLLLLLAGCRASGEEGVPLRRRAEIAEAQGRWLEAGDAWFRLLEAGEDRDPEVARGLARALAAQGDVGGAVSVLEGARGRGAADAALLVDLAQHYAALGHADRALERFVEATTLDPDWALPQREAGIVAAQLGRPGEALGFLEVAHALEPSHARTLLWLARLRAAEERVADSLDAWDALFRVGGFTVDRALQAAGPVLGHEQDWEPNDLERVAGWLARAAARDPQSDAAHRGLARLRIAQGRQDEALEPLRRAVETDPGDLESLYRLAEMRALGGEVERLEALLRHASQVTEDADERARFEALRGIVPRER